MSNTKLIVRLHNLLNLGVVIAVAYSIYLDLLPLALIIALSSKWRILSSNPHRLWRNLKANSCDMVVIVSIVLLMDIYSTPRSSLVGLIILSVLLLVWLLLIKPLQSRQAIIFQAICCQIFGLSALWLYGLGANGLYSFAIILLSGLISAVVARHALQVQEVDVGAPDLRRVITIVWAVIMSQLAWLMWAWSITYRVYSQLVIPQIVLLSIFLGYFVWAMLTRQKSSKAERRRSDIWQVFYFVSLAAAILLLTPWVDI